MLNKAQATTIVILASLWSIGGLRLIYSGSFLLMSSSSHIKGYFFILGILFALFLGFAKGKFVLRKTTDRSLQTVINLKDNVQNCLFGWIKALGGRGLTVIGIMVTLSVLLGGGLIPIDPFYRGLIRIAIGLALIIGSWNYWSDLRKRTQA